MTSVLTDATAPTAVRDAVGTSTDSDGSPSLHLLPGFAESDLLRWASERGYPELVTPVAEAASAAPLTGRLVPAGATPVFCSTQ